MKGVTLIPGDGIGPEVVDAALRVVEATGVDIDWELHKAGATVFRTGLDSGVPPETVASIARTRVVLKGPLETPVGFGEKSANVTLRKLFETFANVRPARELPGVETPFSGRGIDLVVVRENVEDLYAGIEHMQTPTVAQCLKLMSRPGCEKIVRLAFELARAEGRTTVHCATKANIMKLTEGLLKRIFEELAPEYPELDAQHVIVDNCAHQLVRRPEQFDVIVTSNMNGDILSDLTSGLVGGLGFAPSANLGREVAIFEAVHGSAPKYAGRDVANPTALILTAAMLLRHLDEADAANNVEQAVAATLEDGVHTADVPGPALPVGTRGFAEAVIERLGRTSRTWAPRPRGRLDVTRIVASEPAAASGGPREFVGVDVFLESTLRPEELGSSVREVVDGTRLRLKMISNRGTKVFESTGATPECVDHWRCRFVLGSNGSELQDAEVTELLERLGSRHRWMHVEKLQTFAGEAAFTKAQGEN
ncbi:MAG TPA: NADP-dependent isocitrate dehydrogenase [Gaiellaceae bacterium]|nr:NADP-dependent isocitrate dehydrogenase [Gaiellaceae bacterium]